ncbi:MAG TPA: D-glycerate dehydrogenase [Kofleriaceae bacterium]|nr:D-glycerate dehydrogenase [Kofleriaceae bacterium]
MPRVVLTARLPGDVAGILAGHDLVGPSAAEGSWPRARWLAELPAADALICLLTDHVDADVLDRASRLRVIANYAVGFDNIDRAAAAARGILVANTPDVLTEATADLAFALLLAAARRLGEGERLLRSGGWHGWSPGLLHGVEVHGQTLGIVGLGRVGRAVARRAHGFGMTIVASGHADRAPDVRDAPGITPLPLDELLARADFVSLHTPLTAATRHLIDARALARMKPTAVLVNTARGEVVDEAALADALERGHLAGAGLDVFANEPHVDPRLLAAPRLVLLPHLGSATAGARARMGELCASAVAAVLRGERPPNLVPPPAARPAEARA